MLHLTTKLKLTNELASAPNLTSRFSDEDLTAIGAWVWDGYEADQRSRAPWLRRMQAAMDLALQIVKEKSFPWPTCSNVAFPLVTIGALQFHSRAYPALVSGPQVVKCSLYGADPDGSQQARCDRVSSHMSYQVLEEDESWEEEHDRLLIALPILGCCFKKSYHAARKGHNVSELVFPQHLVADYFTKSCEDAGRLTHILPASRNEMLENMLRGVYADYSDEAWLLDPAQPLQTEHLDREDLREGKTPPTPDDATPFTRLEQHCWMDADGDGYAEPYIVTIEATTKKVLRIVARWSSDEDVERTAKGRVISIKPESYFTKYSLIPSPDGSFYDLGFGILLGPLNESVNSLVNQLIDAGTWATTAGGFLGRGAKIRGGTYSFAPLEWKRVDATGDDLQKSIFPLPVREPSAVLFQLLGLLINYTERISGATDMLVGENPGQNTPAETSRAMVEQGMKIYTAIFKRVWRSMKWEFKKLFILNGRYLPLRLTYGAEGYTAQREDYLTDPGRICPAADPNMVSEGQRMQQAVTLKEAARVTAGYDVEAVERHFLRALKVENIDQLYPGPAAIPQGESEKITLQKMKMQETQLKLQAEQMRFVAELMEEQRVNSAEIVRLQAEAAKLTAEAADVGATTQVTALQAMVSAAESRQQAAMQRIEQVLRSVELAQGWKELALKDKEIEVKKNEPAPKS